MSKIRPTCAGTDLILTLLVLDEKKPIRMKSGEETEPRRTGLVNNKRRIDHPVKKTDTLESLQELQLKGIRNLLFYANGGNLITAK